MKYNWIYKRNKFKRKFIKANRYYLSSNHLFSENSNFLNTLNSIEKIEYSPSPNNIKRFLTIKNELLFSAVYKKYNSCEITYSILTLKLGNIKAFKNSEYKYSSKKNAFFYRITSMFDDKSVWYIGLQYDNNLKQNIYYKIKFNYYTVGLNFNNFIINQNSIAYLYWGVNNNIRTGLGYNLDFASYLIKPSIFPFLTFGYLFKLNIKTKKRILFKNYTIPDPEEERDMF